MSTLLRLTVQGGLLILAAALLRALLQACIPRRAFVALWLVAVLRLVLPVEVYSPVSVYRAVSWGVGAVEGGGRTPSTAHAVPLPQEGGWEGTGGGLREGDLGRSGGDAVNWLLIVYLTGAVLLALYFLCAHIYYRRRFRRARRVAAGPARAYMIAHGGRGVRLLAAPDIQTPITYGLIRPRIVLPESVLGDGDALPYILAHELAHIRRFDAPLKLLVAAALCAHWFNPCVWLLFILYNRDVELACDAGVLNDLNPAQKKTYAHLLLSMQVSQSLPSPLTSGFSRHCIKERITAIMRYKKTSALSVILALALVISMTCAFATSPVEPLPADDAVELLPLATPQPLVIGADAEDVYLMKEDLAQLGYLYPLQVDDVYDSATMEAVRQFQRSLPQTGECDAETGALLASPEAIISDTELPVIQDYDLVVDVSDQTVYAYLRGTDDLVREMRCSTGLESTPTPLGEFRENTGPGARWHYFKSFNCWAQYAFYIEGDILFHSVLYSRRGGEPTDSSVSSLGRQASHGNVRLAVEDAKWIWENCEAGTLVVVRK